MTHDNRWDGYIHRKRISNMPFAGYWILWIVGPIVLFLFSPLAYIEAAFGGDGVRYTLYGLGGLIVAGFFLFRVIKGHWPLQRPWKPDAEDL